MSYDETHAEELLEQAVAGDSRALGELLQTYRNRLLGIVEFRMDSRMRGRLDSQDVLQESFIEASQRFNDYAANPTMPFFLWLRFITVQRLLQLHRRHLGAKARDVTREVSIFAGPHPQATSAVLAAHLLGRQTSPSANMMKLEMKMRLERALNTMEAIDREVLALRHFEQLSNVEVAKLLEISETASSNRYMRALKRLKRAMDVSHA